MVFAKRSRNAATLIETLVITGLFGLAFALLLPLLQQARERASQATCQLHLKNLVLAVHSHHTQKGRMPPYASGRPGEIYGGWYMHLLPYVDRGDLYALLQTNQVTKNMGLTIATLGGQPPGDRKRCLPGIGMPIRRKPSTCEQPYKLPGKLVRTF